MKKPKQRKLRNDAALAAIFHPGIKIHPDKKKEEKRKRCRQKHRPD